ncbi:MAG TPA: carbamoyltransferase C-terminal domain-containing protein [Acidimicrobiales bacterium]|nr:carbamoyltransferase C-terminal domain-containing protein [Acidimicrobiales bacterium]
MITLGINAYHGDASAAIFVDGVLMAAVEEERFTRQKHQAGFPSESVRWCLNEVGASIHEVEHAAVSRDPFAHLPRKVAWALRRRPTRKSITDRVRNTGSILDAADALARASGLASGKELTTKLHRVEHHKAHLASALCPSPYETAACVTLDGMGDFLSSAWGRGVGGKLDVQGVVSFPDSLGVFYTSFTQFLGLPAFGDEYKLMGLAAYGEPTFLPQMRDVVRVGEGMRYELDLSYFTHHDKGVEMTWGEGSPALGPMFSPKMAEAFGPAREFRSELTDRDRDLACSVQRRLEEVELEYLRRLHERVPERAVVMAGGVALNVLANGLVRSETPFEDVWVQPAANDSGTAIGAAQYVMHHVLGHPRTWTMRDAYTGPGYDEDVCVDALKRSGLFGGAARYDDAALFAVVAQRLTEGAVIGWYQGRAELGPRALGNRSIVCDPRRHDMKDILNARIKHREPFRPFAPSVLADRAGDWFEDAYDSPYMLLAFKVRADKAAQVPAITHEDGTARVQTVTVDTNPRYYGLIRAFGDLTGVPMLLNTSFNENEPIVCTPSEAVDCFGRTDMDVLVLGNHVVDRGGRR